MRGMFTCGVLDVLMEHGIDFDGAAGVSAGAVFGCNFKSHQIEKYSARNITFEIEEDTHWTLDGEYEKGNRVCEIKTLESAISLIR